MARLFTPGPVTVPERVLKAMARQVISHRGSEFRRLLEDVEEKLRRVYGLEDGVVVVLAGSGTTAVDAMLWSLATGARTLVVVHGEFGYRMLASLRAAGAEPLKLEYEAGMCPSIDDVQRVVEEGGVEFLAIVHNETSTGVAVKHLEEVARVAYKHGVHVLVDTVSGLGGEAFKMHRGIAAAASCSHKALAAPPGVSFVALSAEAVELLRKRRVRMVPPALDLAKYVEFLETRRETPYTPPVNTLYALNEALSIVLEKGVENYVEQHRRRAMALYSRLEDVVKPVPVHRSCRSNTVAAFWVNSATAVKRMLEERGFVIAAGMGAYRDKMIRIGLMGAISVEDVVELADTITSIVKEVSGPGSSPS